MKNIQKINDSIESIIKNLYEFKKLLIESNSGDEVAPDKIGQIVQQELEDFDSLRKALESEKWPEAVNVNLICDPTNEQDKLERGRGVIDLMIEFDIKDKKLLDFGCGEGHLPFVAASDYESTMAVGYDCLKNDKWSNFQKENLMYSDDWNDVLKNGPYDVIVIFDVIDHAKNENAVSILNKAREALKYDGRIYMRCHPYISRHGTHLYHHLNKSYAHLVFTKEELTKIVPDQRFVEDNINVIFPLITYKEFITKSNLEVESMREIRSNVDSFFKIPKIAERIIKNNSLTSFPEFQMGIDFVDYVLKMSN